MARYFKLRTINALRAQLELAITKYKTSEKDMDAFGDASVDNLEWRLARYELNSLTKQIRKDLDKVEFDFENVTCNGWNGKHNPFLGFHTLENGLSYLGCQAGGDWEYPVYFIIYLDNKDKLRAYIPTKGNHYNTNLKSAFGNNDDVDEAEDSVEYIPFMIEDIQNRIIEK